ncbi:MAG: hypothetical protein HC764_16820 [Pleurocapsa sp. CRU_1_2]|nr:hypothetical protein [Pleurocapsa sp. CRU_1_2]
MVNYQNFAVKLIAILAIALINLIEVIPAAATTENFQLNSFQGYRVETSFNYDETKNIDAIAEHGKKASLVDSVKVRFYNPDGKLIASYDNIVDGIIQNNYFEFNYDLNTQQLIGKVDLGGESAGEMYLKGDAAQELSLVLIDPSGKEKVIDQVKM